MDNPLLNELILSQLFSYLTLQELKNCRLVCKKWNYETNPKLWRKIKIEFFGYDIRNLKKFLTDMSSTIDFPFGRFGIQIWDTESYRSRFQSLPQDVEHFFVFCGPHMKQLRLGFNDFLETVTVGKFRKWFFSSIPNLQILELSGLSFRVIFVESIFNNENDQTAPIGIEIFQKLNELSISDSFGDNLNPDVHERYKPNVLLDLLRMCPFLQTFTINTGELSSSLAPSAIFALGQLRPPYLTTLRLQCIIFENDLEVIFGAYFVLQVLEIHALDHDVQKTTLEKLLTSQRNSLRKLLIAERESVRQQPQPQPGPGPEQRPHLPQITFLQFPRMELLNSLTIIRRSTTRKLAFCQNIYYESLQHLNILDLSTILNNLEDFFPTNFGENLTLRSLSLPYAFADANLLEVILKNFSKLKSLFLECPSDEILMTVWNFGIGLEELELVNICILGEVADSVFTGIPIKICEWIQEGNAYFRVNDNFFEVVNRQKSICNLHNLRRLVLDFQTNPELMYFITDTTMYLGIQNLKELTSLTVKNSEISSDCYKWISDNCSLVYLEVTGHES